MKIDVVATRFPPERCGVGDYTRRLLEALVEQGHDLRLHTTTQSPAFRENDITKQNLPIEIRKFAWPLSDGELKSFVQQIVDRAPDEVIFQFTPNRFPILRGQNRMPDVLGALLDTRPAWRGKIVINVHEAHYPLHFSVRGLLHGLPQRRQMLNMLKLCDHATFTYAAPCEEFRRVLPSEAAKMSVLPVGSNVLLSDSLRSRDSKQKTLTLLHFGGRHPTHLYDYMYAALTRLRQSQHDEVELLLVGVDASEIERCEGVRALGYLPEDEVSRCLNRADLVLAPFLDGVSTRRGSVMAALLHGRAVITTRGSSTDSETPWREFTLISEANDCEAFCQNVELAVGNASLAERLALNGKNYHDVHFSWSAIAKRLQDVIS